MMPYRSIDTDIWNDEGPFPDLSIAAKLVWMRLTFGPEMKRCGAVKINRRMMAPSIAPDADLELVDSAIAELLEHPKLLREYDDGWLFVPKFMKHNGHSPLYRRSCVREARGLPQSLQKVIVREVESLGGTGREKDKNDPSSDKDRTKKETITSTNGIPIPQPYEEPYGEGSPIPYAEGYAGSQSQGQGGHSPPGPPNPPSRLGGAEPGGSARSELEPIPDLEDLGGVLGEAARKAKAAAEQDEHEAERLRREAFGESA